MKNISFYLQAQRLETHSSSNKSYLFYPPLLIFTIIVISILSFTLPNQIIFKSFQKFAFIRWIESKFYFLFVTGSSCEGSSFSYKFLSMFGLFISCEICVLYDRSHLENVKFLFLFDHIYWIYAHCILCTDVKNISEFNIS